MVADTLTRQALEQPEGGFVYLTDGKRLVEVIGLDADANFRLADCAADPDDPEAMITVGKDELIRDWKLVRADG